MKWGAYLVFAFFLSTCCLGQPTPRVAVIDFAGDVKGEVGDILRAVAGGFEVVDSGQVGAAIRGAGYLGNLNLSCDEARSLGGSLGCDFYFLGQVQNLRRLGSKNESYFEALAGIFLVETRNGRVVLFDFISAQSESEGKALALLISKVKTHTRDYSLAIGSATEEQRKSADAPVISEADVIEILDGEVSAKGIEAPVFYQRLKPSYPVEAGLANITATVELTAVFGADGRVGEVTITRWAGFGLDQAAIETVRGLRFKPAERDGRAVNVKALVRYNFRKPASLVEREAEAERLRRSLRQIQKPE